jgi:hypothetical protein
MEDKTKETKNELKKVQMKQVLCYGAVVALAVFVGTLGAIKLAQKI